MKTLRFTIRQTADPKNLDLLIDGREAVIDEQGITGVEIVYEDSAGVKHYWLESNALTASNIVTADGPTLQDELNTLKVALTDPTSLVVTSSVIIDPALYSPPSYSNVYFAHFIETSPGTLIAIGQHETTTTTKYIYKSIDNGVSWTKTKQVTTNGSLVFDGTLTSKSNAVYDSVNDSIFFVTIANLGAGLSKFVYVYKTNGIASTDPVLVKTIEIPNPESADAMMYPTLLLQLNGIVILVSPNGVVAKNTYSNYNKVWSTTNGGTTWTETVVDFGDGYRLNGISTDKFVITTMTANTISHSTDGVNWTTISAGTTETPRIGYVNSEYIVYSGEVGSVADKDKVRKSTDLITFADHDIILIGGLDPTANSHRLDVTDINKTFQMSTSFIFARSEINKEWYYSNDGINWKLFTYMPVGMKFSANQTMITKSNAIKWLPGNIAGTSRLGHYSIYTIINLQ